MFGLRIFGLVLLTALLAFLGTPPDDPGVGSGLLAMGFGVLSVWVCFRGMFEDAVGRALVSCRRPLSTSRNKSSLAEGVLKASASAKAA